MLTKEGANRPFVPSGPGGVAAAEMREAPDIAAVTSRLERLEQYARASAQPLRPAWREPTLQPRDDRDSEYDPAGGPALLRARRSAGISPWLFVMATALNTTVAALLAVIITLGVVESQSRESQSAAAPPPAVPGGVTRVSTGYVGEAPRPALTQALTVLPIGSASQPLQLEARKPAPLPLQIQPGNAGLEPFIVVLGGAPAGTTLSGGASRIGSDTWFLPSGAANRLEITLPEWSSAPFEVAIELRRTNGQVAAHTTAWIAVPPPGGLETTGLGTDQTATKELLAQGSRLIERGEIVAARSVYQRAAEMGSGDAALALGATYDPNRLWALGAMGMVGNKERAKHWYARANELGHPDANSRLRLLAN